MGTTDRERGSKMPCYHPRLRIVSTSEKPIKGKNGKFYRKGIIEQPHDLHKRLEELSWNPGIQTEIIPCKQCIGCRLESSRTWANRGYLESKMYDENWFVTVTYKDEYLYVPEEITTSDEITYTNDNDDWKGCLVKEDLKKFIHNVRQKWKRKFDFDGIRFMACGEYGEEGERPHYHIIFFNMHIPLEDLYDTKIINDNVYYKSHLLDECWNNKGFVEISEATWNDIAYTARYITKKINGTESEYVYAERGQIKEFFNVSRMPGIGEPYFREHYKEIYKNDEIIVKNLEGIISCKPPKYFDDLYEKMDPEAFEKIKIKRRRRAINVAKVKDSTTSLHRLAQLEIEERSHEERSQKLIREFERKAPS